IRPQVSNLFPYTTLFRSVLVLACVSISVYALYISRKTIAQAQQKVFVLVNGKALEAYSADRKDNIPVEAKDHVKMFHHYFFTLRSEEHTSELQSRGHLVC